MFPSNSPAVSSSLDSHSIFNLYKQEAARPQHERHLVAAVVAVAS